MFVILSKLLPPLIYPMGFVALLLGLGLILRKRKHWQTAANSLALAILLITGNSWVALGLARSLEWRYLPQGDLPHAQAIVVLGGGTVSAQPPRKMVEVNGAGDRMLYAAKLYHDGKAPLLLLSGGSIEWLDARQSSIAAEMAEVLGWLAVPPEAMILQEQSRNTYEDAVYSAEILKQKGITRILLVTSAMHMPRSVALFEQQGLEVIPAPTDFTVSRDQWESITTFNLPAQLIALIPGAGNMNLTTSALKEYIGMGVYRLRGWIR